MIDYRRFKRVFAREIEAAGFERKSGAWYRSSRDIVVVLEPQKSNYDEQVYLNVGFSTDGGDYPKPESCGVNCRAEDLGAEAALMVLHLGREDLSTEKHEQLIQEWVRDELLHIVDNLRSSDDLKGAYREGAFRGCLIVKSMRRFLES